MAKSGELAASNTVSIWDDFFEEHFEVFRHGELDRQAADQHLSNGLTVEQALEYEAIAIDS